MMGKINEVLSENQIFPSIASFIHSLKNQIYEIGQKRFHSSSYFDLNYTEQKSSWYFCKTKKSHFLLLFLLGNAAAISFECVAKCALIGS